MPIRNRCLIVNGKPGGSHINMVYVLCACLLGRFFAKFGIAIRGFSSETKDSNLHKLCVFGAISCKKHPNLSNWVLFFRKWYTDGREIGQTIGIATLYQTIGIEKAPPPPPLKTNNSQMYAGHMMPMPRLSMGVTVGLYIAYLGIHESDERLLYLALLTWRPLLRKRGTRNFLSYPSEVLEYHLSGAVHWINSMILHYNRMLLFYIRNWFALFREALNRIKNRSSATNFSVV